MRKDETGISISFTVEEWVHLAAVLDTAMEIYKEEFNQSTNTKNIVRNSKLITELQCIINKVKGGSNEL